MSPVYITNWCPGVCEVPKGRQMVKLDRSIFHIDLNLAGACLLQFIISSVLLNRFDRSSLALVNLQRSILLHCHGGALVLLVLSVRHTRSKFLLGCLYINLGGWDIDTNNTGDIELLNDLSCHVGNSSKRLLRWRVLRDNINRTLRVSCNRHKMSNQCIVDCSSSLWGWRKCLVIWLLS